MLTTDSRIQTLGADCTVMVTKGSPEGDCPLKSTGHLDHIREGEWGCQAAGRWSSQSCPPICAVSVPSQTCGSVGIVYCNHRTQVYGSPKPHSATCTSQCPMGQHQQELSPLQLAEVQLPCARECSPGRACEGCGHPWHIWPTPAPVPSGPEWPQHR